MNYAILRSEIFTDPLTRGYSGMNDAQVATSLNTVDRTRNRSVMNGKEVKDRIDLGEWAARTDAQKQIVLAMCNRDDLDPFGIDATIFQDAMAGATTTLANLNTYRVEDVSRGEELGLGVVSEADVYAARNGT